MEKKKKDILRIIFVFALSFMITFVLILIVPSYIVPIVLISFVIVIGVGSLLILLKINKILKFGAKE
jgi:hypothetical protein